MSLTPDQLAKRRAGIGGSEAAAVCGRHPTKSRLDVWISKVYPESDTPGGARAEAGTRLEPAVAQWAADELGTTLDTAPARTASLVHAARPYMLANLDGLLGDDRILEVKCLDSRRAFLLDEAGGQEPLVEHQYQVQHYMEVADRDAAVVAYLVGGNDLRLFEVARDREFGGIIAEAEEQFWRDYVLAQRRPEDGDAETVALALKLRHPKDNGLLATGAGDVLVVASAVMLARRTAKAAESAKQAAENELKALIGDAAGFDFGKDIGKATWKATKGRPVVDTKALAAESPEVAALIKKHTRLAPSRQLRVTLAGFDATEED